MSKTETAKPEISEFSITCTVGTGRFNQAVRFRCFLSASVRLEKRDKLRLKYLQRKPGAVRDSRVTARVEEQIGQKPAGWNHGTRVERLSNTSGLDSRSSQDWDLKDQLPE